jgi:hypothetical protein
MFSPRNRRSSALTEKKESPVDTSMCLLSQPEKEII